MTADHPEEDVRWLLNRVLDNDVMGYFELEEKIIDALDNFTPATSLDHLTVEPIKLLSDSSEGPRKQERPKTFWGEDSLFFSLTYELAIDPQGDMS